MLMSWMACEPSECIYKRYACADVVVNMSLPLGAYKRRRYTCADVVAEIISQLKEHERRIDVDVLPFD